MHGVLTTRGHTRIEGMGFYLKVKVALVNLTWDYALPLRQALAWQIMPNLQGTKKLCSKLKISDPRHIKARSPLTNCNYQSQ